MASVSVYSYPTAYTTIGSISGTKYRNAIGKGADTDAASGNDYASSSGSYSYISYSFDFSGIPADATIDSVTCQVKGHCESTSNSNRRSRLQLYAGTTAKGSYSDFTSTSAQTLTLTTGTWTRAEIDTMTLRFTIGYYGGLVNGATVTVTYTKEADPATITFNANGGTGTMPAVTVDKGDMYPLPACTFTPPAGVDQWRFDHWTIGAEEYAVGDEAEITGDTTAVAQWVRPTIYIKTGSGWVPMDAGYEKETGAWAQKGMSSLFQSGHAYRKGTEES